MHGDMDLPDGDLLIHCGDFTNYGMESEIYKFNTWLGTIKHKYKHIIVIAGNHELSFDEENEQDYKQAKFFRKKIGNVNFKEAKKLLTNCIYLEHQGIEIEGLKIFGTPYLEMWNGWAFNRHPSILKKIFDTINPGMDILLTHAPPWGFCDVNEENNHCGNKLVRQLVERVKPKMHLFGHIHEGHGVEKCMESGIIYSNGAFADEYYQPTNSSTVFFAQKESQSSAWQFAVIDKLKTKL